MTPRQLHLFELSRPLLERFGEDFFKRAPTEPGVYVMSGAGGQILYVGQSSNLRDRLGSYKNARPDIAPRKVVRLVRQVTTISWETCGSPVQAKLRENELIRLYRPKFNRVNIFPGAYPFIYLNPVAGELRLGLTRSPDASGELYGAFKGGASVAYAALLRLTWWRLNQAVSAERLPAGLLSGRPPTAYSFQKDPRNTHAQEHVQALRHYLAGHSDVLLDGLALVVPPETGRETGLFEQRLRESDQEILRHFYTRGTQPLASYKRQSDSQWMPQHEVDDWVVLSSERHSQCPEAPGAPALQLPATSG